MDLYRIQSLLGKSYTAQSGSDYCDRPTTCHEMTKSYGTNDLLNRSAWNAIIHQPSQDSEPEDLPSTVDMDAIKEPATPLGTAAQTPASQLHGDGRYYLSDEQGGDDSGTESDSDSDSDNTDTEIEDSSLVTPAQTLVSQLQGEKDPNPSDDQPAEESGSESDSESDSSNSDADVEREDASRDSYSWSDSDSVSSRHSNRPKLLKPISSRSFQLSQPSPGKAVQKFSIREQNLDQLPESCKLSEDSDNSSEDEQSKIKKETGRDTIEKLAQQFREQPDSSLSTEHLQVINQEDLAAILPDVEANNQSNDPFDELNQLSTSNVKKDKPLLHSTDTVAMSSDSGSDTELLPKQEQIVQNVINSINVDSSDHENRGKSVNNSSDSGSDDEKPSKPDPKIKEVDAKRSSNTSAIKKPTAMFKGGKNKRKSKKQLATSSAVAASVRGAPPQLQPKCSNLEQRFKFPDDIIKVPPFQNFSAKTVVVNEEKNKKKNSRQSVNSSDVKKDNNTVRKNSNNNNNDSNKKNNSNNNNNSGKSNNYNLKNNVDEKPKRARGRPKKILSTTPSSSATATATIVASKSTAANGRSVGDDATTSVKFGTNDKIVVKSTNKTLNKKKKKKSSPPLLTLSSSSSSSSTTNNNNKDLNATSKHRSAVIVADTPGGGRLKLTSSKVPSKYIIDNIIDDDDDDNNRNHRSSKNRKKKCKRRSSSVSKFPTTKRSKYTFHNGRSYYWSHKHKKWKVEKSKIIDQKLLSLIDDLASKLKTCSIREQPSSNNDKFETARLKQHTNKERGAKKKKHSVDKNEKGSLDAENIGRCAPLIGNGNAHSAAVANSIGNGSKRRLKKNSIDAPNILETNIDQRLPLKKRRILPSSSICSAINNNNNNNSSSQTADNGKTKIDNTSLSSEGHKQQSSSTFSIGSSSSNSKIAHHKNPASTNKTIESIKLKHDIRKKFDSLVSECGGDITKPLKDNHNNILKHSIPMILTNNINNNNKSSSGIILSTAAAANRQLSSLSSVHHTKNDVGGGGDIISKSSLLNKHFATIPIVGSSSSSSSTTKQQLLPPPILHKHSSFISSNIGKLTTIGNDKLIQHNKRSSSGNNLLSSNKNNHHIDLAKHLADVQNTLKSAAKPVKTADGVSNKKKKSVNNTKHSSPTIDVSDKRSRSSVVFSASSNNNNNNNNKSSVHEKTTNSPTTIGKTSNSTVSIVVKQSTAKKKTSNTAAAQSSSTSRVDGKSKKKKVAKNLSKKKKPVDKSNNNVRTAFKTTPTNSSSVVNVGKSDKKPVVSSSGGQSKDKKISSPPDVISGSTSSPLTSSASDEKLRWSKKQTAEPVDNNSIAVASSSSVKLVVPPAGVFEPSEKTLNALSQVKKPNNRNIADVLSKLTEKLKDLKSSPEKSTFFEKIGGLNRQIASPPIVAAVPPLMALDKSLAMKRTIADVVGGENVDENSRRKRKAGLVKISIPKLSRSELTSSSLILPSSSSSSSIAVATMEPLLESLKQPETKEDQQPVVVVVTRPLSGNGNMEKLESDKKKLKRKKSINRTGFPIRKKKKKNVPGSSSSTCSNSSNGSNNNNNNNNNVNDSNKNDVNVVDQQPIDASFKTTDNNVKNSALKELPEIIDKSVNNAFKKQSVVDNSVNGNDASLITDNSSRAVIVTDNDNVTTQTNNNSATTVNATNDTTSANNIVTADDKNVINAKISSDVTTNMGVTLASNVITDANADINDDASIAISNVTKIRNNAVTSAIITDPDTITTIDVDEITHTDTVDIIPVTEANFITLNTTTTTSNSVNKLIVNNKNSKNSNILNKNLLINSKKLETTIGKTAGDKNNKKKVLNCTAKKKTAPTSLNKKKSFKESKSKSKTTSINNESTTTPGTRCSDRIRVKKQKEDEEKETTTSKFDDSTVIVDEKTAATTTDGIEKSIDEQGLLSKLEQQTSKIKNSTKKSMDNCQQSTTLMATVSHGVSSNEDRNALLENETDKILKSNGVDDAARKKQKKLSAGIKKLKPRYLPSGSFSDNDYNKEEKFVSPVVKNSQLICKPVDDSNVLLPPASNCNGWIPKKRVDFQLNQDLWRLHARNKLPGKELVPSWNYKKIRSNVYYDIKPPYMYEAQACNCQVPPEKDKKGCGEDCINRLIYAECSPQLCSLKDRCSNQKIQKHDWAPDLVKFMTKDKGWGIKTTLPIKVSEFILEYVGEVVSEKEFKKRMTCLYHNDTHHYCLNLDGGLVIDGHRMGGDARFVNHSCEPNCEMQKWSVNGLFRMALFALRDIKPDEELTYDYNFSLFNPAEGQPCKCGSSVCRGVIGGKYQRVNIESSANCSTNNGNAQSMSVTNNGTDKKLEHRHRSRKCLKKINQCKENDQTQSLTRRHRCDSSVGNASGTVVQNRLANYAIPFKQLTPDEKKIIMSDRTFLVRNLNKVQQLREKFKDGNGSTLGKRLNGKDESVMNGKPKQSDVFLTQLNALSTQRFIRTRRLAQAQENPEVTKTVHLATVYRNIYNDVINAKDEKEEPLSTLFMNLPSKRKLPSYYQRISEPIDLTTIEQNIITGVYKSVESFDKDMNKLFFNNVKFYGRTSDRGILATRLRKEYNIAKLKYAPQIKEIMGSSLPANFIPEQEDPGDEDEDVIRCICGLFNDEGLMIQCERCLVWQHCDCVKADTNADHYLCERCKPRDVDYEISLDIAPDYAKPNEKHYLTLLRDNLQIRQGDTVYVLRDIHNPETGIRHTFRTIKNFKFEDCDIFRIERLWKNEKGERLSFGHHYLRPHETFHEPSRKFFPNEVVKIPLYETVPLDLIMGQCYVLDLNTYCKGRPVNSDPEHMYICELRVDKAARLFYRMPKSKQFQVCTKNFAFEKYDVRLKPSRSFAPHGLNKPISTTNSGTSSSTTDNNNKKDKDNKTTVSSTTIRDGARSVSTAATTITSTTTTTTTTTAGNVVSSSSKQKQHNNKTSTKLDECITLDSKQSSVKTKNIKNIAEDQAATSGVVTTVGKSSAAAMDSSIKPDEGETVSQEKDNVFNAKVEGQKYRLNAILLRLLTKGSSKTPLDASYLLDIGRRNRKKPVHLTS